MVWVWFDSNGYLLAHSDNPKEADSIPGSKRVDLIEHHRLKQLAHEYHQREYAKRWEDKQNGS